MIPCLNKFIQCNWIEIILKLSLFFSSEIKCGFWDLLANKIKHRLQIIMRNREFCFDRLFEFFKFLFSQLFRHFSHEICYEFLNLRSDKMRIFCWRNKYEIKSKNSSGIEDSCCEIIRHLLLSSEFIEERFFNVIFKKL